MDDSRSCIAAAGGHALALSMWDLPRPKKRWYRRWWFTIPFFTLLLLGIAGLVVYSMVTGEYEAKARQFDYARLDAMESASLMLDKNGVLIGRIFTQNRDQVPYTEMSGHLINAVIAREDSRFYEHKGVDYKGVMRAVYENWKSSTSKQGASTITQQLARNTFPEELPATDRTKERKLLEMFVAFEIEKIRTKEQILNLYLNRVYFGNGFFGAEAAAKGYYGKRAKELTISEAALLAGLLRSPDRLSPWRNYSGCIVERNVVLNNLLQQQRISRADYDTAFKDEPVLRNKRPIHQDNYAADMVYQQVLKKVGKDRALGEGLRIHTTIDAGLQKKAEESLNARLAAIEMRPDWEHQTFAKYDAIFEAAKKNPVDANGKRIDPEYLQGGAVMLDNRTGAIRAIVGGRDFKHSQLNRMTQVQIPPGTAFKPLVYAAAFEQGFFPGTAVQDAVIDNTKVMMGGTTGILGEWGPERQDNRFEGTISARTALVMSKNAATARLGMMTGIQPVLDLCEDAGISGQLAAFPKTYLGGSEVTPMDLTIAYTMFPNGGVRPEKPFVISRIEDKAGNVIFQEKSELVPAIKDTTAYEVHSCLSQVLEPGGTAERATLELGLAHIPLGGKTGTAYNFTDLWFCGYSSEITCSVWIGLDRQRGKQKEPIFRGAFSKDLALPIWADLMKAGFADYKPREFIRPKGLIRVEICRASGGLACEKCADNGVRTTYQEMATEEQAPRDPCPVHSGIVRAPAVAGGDPSAKKATLRLPESLTPIPLKGNAVLGDDPYHSVEAVARMLQLAGVGNAQASLITSENIPAGDPAAVKNPDAPAPVPVVAPPAPRPDVKLDPPEPLKFR